MIKQFIQHLGLKFLRTEAAELIYECPWCQGQKFYVNSKTGAWQCFHGCGEGHLYQLVKRKLPTLESKEIFKLLEQFGLNHDNPSAKGENVKPPKKDIRWFTGTLREPFDSELVRLCVAKNIDYNILKRLEPKAMKQNSILCLPVYNPQFMPVPCGYIRVHMDGNLIRIKASGKDEKYPVIGNVGLLGLPWLVNQQYDEILFCEGWRDMMAAMTLGYAAVASSAGASSWKNEWLPIFKGKKVIIIMDEDAAGVGGWITQPNGSKIQKKGAALRAATAIVSVAENVKIVRLPFTWQENHGKDLHDYIVRDGHSTEDLNLLLTQAPAYATEAEPSEQGKGVVILPDDHPDTIASAFWQNSKKNDVQHKYNRFDGWSIFYKGKYQRVEDIKEIRLHIRKFITNCWIKKGRGDKAYRVRVKQSSGFIGDILEALAAMPRVHLLPKKKAPCSLDDSLDAEHVIAAKNVLIDISKRPHITHPITEQFYTLNYLTYEYVKGAFPDKWASFLADITMSDIDLMLLLQQWCGYLLLPTLKYQKFLLCVGDGANGKGVFFDTITAALSQQNVSNVPLARFSNPYALFGTYGKLVNMSNENTKDVENNAESIIKEYVAGDKILWEQKYHDAFFAYPTAKLMFATNELPRIKDTTDGIWRRMILVPFEAKFTGDKQNTNLARELQQPDELAGILNWMIEGAEILEKMGKFVEPKKCKNALNKYRDESDSARLFLLEHIEADLDVELHPCQIPCTWLHQQYQKWCDANGYKPKNNVHFGQTLHQMLSVQKSRPWFGTKKINVYLGIRPQQGSEVGEELEKWTA